MIFLRCLLTKYHLVCWIITFISSQREQLKCLVLRSIMYRGWQQCFPILGISGYVSTVWNWTRGIRWRGVSGRGDCWRIVCWSWRGVSWSGVSWRGWHYSKCITGVFSLLDSGHQRNSTCFPLVDQCQNKPTNGYRSWIIVLPAYGKDSWCATYWKLYNKESWDVQSSEGWY